MNVDEAIRDLLNISTDVTHVVVLGPDGQVLASGPDPADEQLGAAAARLWEAGARKAAALGDAALEHLVVPGADGAVGMLEADGRRIVAVTGPRPAVGLLLFDLRTCLGDAFGEGVRA